MVIEVISSSTVKITLEKEDMLRYGIKFEMLNKTNIETKILLSSLISIVKSNETIELDSERIYIEAFELNDGGCVIYISSFPEKPERITARVIIPDKVTQEFYLTMEINSVKDLSKLISALPKEFVRLVKESKLYFDNNNYRLVLKTTKKLDKQLEKWASNYCFQMDDGQIHASLTDEHWDCLIENNALKNMQEKLLT